jgi:UPF0716 protein FxsA
MLVLFQISQEIGLLNTLGLVAITGLAGAWAVKREGIRLIMKIKQSITAKEISRNLLEGGVLTGGGLMLLTPGIVTDFIGFLLVFRPFRERITVKLEQKISESYRFQVEVM